MTLTDELNSGTLNGVIRTLLVDKGETTPEVLREQSNWDTEGEDPISDEKLAEIVALVNTSLRLISEEPYPFGIREELTDIALQLSLCPMHLVDYAICFDDDTPSCRAIRTIHPSHDT